MNKTKEAAICLTELRENAGLNKSRLAEQLGVRVGFICQLETDECSIPAGRVSQLAAALSVTEDEITLLRGDLPEDVKLAFEQRSLLLINLIRALQKVADYEIGLFINYLATTKERHQ